MGKSAYGNLGQRRDDDGDDYGDAGDDGDDDGDGGDEGGDDDGDGDQLGDSGNQLVAVAPLVNGKEGESMRQL